MIKIERITIHEFRGIRDLTLDLNGQNFAACGPNGTGKSGIVDAIEFALSGNISRLSGAGTGGLSVKSHGPHVDCRNKPELASVTLEVIIPSLGGKSATIQRTVNAPNAPKVTPSNEETLALFKKVNLHPEFVLSRRELIRYVLSEPGNRSKEVQSLLRLDAIEKLRGLLQKIANACIREVPDRERLEKEAMLSLLSALDRPKLSKTDMLEAVNPRRELLGLKPLADIDNATSVKDGLTNSVIVVTQRVPKAQAGNDLSTVKQKLESMESEGFKESCATAEAMTNALLKDEWIMNGLSREELLKSALEQYDGKECPVCSSPFEPEPFRKHIAQKLNHFDEVCKRRNELESKLKPIIDIIYTTDSAIGSLVAYADQFAPKVDAAELVRFKTNLTIFYQQLKKWLPLKDTCAVLNAVQHVPDLTGALDNFAKAIGAIPEPSKQDAARDFLVVAQERLEQYRSARRKVKESENRSLRAKKVFDTYGRVTTEALDKIYKAVESTFSSYYRKINEDDESSFSAKLLPSMGKLGFDVDFYGRGHFPPGAYHSEGHQDGMGLCLYLALMNHLLGANFTFAVLDDVLMSVDAGHRRQVCSLLKEKFPNTQFFFTTHDEIWLRHMKTEGLIKNKGFTHFRTWTVDLGPTEWSDRVVWDELDEHLNLNDVRAAAGLLRHYLEHFSKEACDRLRAKVEFRGDAQFMLGDLLPSAISTLGDLLKKAKSAANSWKKEEEKQRITGIEKSFSEAKIQTSNDQWQINTAVHFNEWANLRKEDFRSVVESFHSLTAAFYCKTCEGMLFVSPNRGKKEVLRCNCGDFYLNLIEKE